MCRSNQGVIYNVLLLSSTDTSVQLRAAVTLCNLASNNQENQNSIRLAGAIPHLTNLLSSDDPRVQYIAACALLDLAHNNQENQNAIREASAIPHIINF